MAENINNISIINSQQNNPNISLHDRTDDSCRDESCHEEEKIFYYDAENKITFSRYANISGYDADIDWAKSQSEEDEECKEHKKQLAPKETWYVPKSDLGVLNKYINDIFGTAFNKTAKVLKDGVETEVPVTGYIGISTDCHSGRISVDGRKILDLPYLLKIMSKRWIDNLYFTKDIFVPQGMEFCARDNKKFMSCLLAVDIDYHHAYEKKQQAWTKKEDINNMHPAGIPKPMDIARYIIEECCPAYLPVPNYIEYSRNLRFIYILNEPISLKCPTGSQIKKAEKKLTEHFCNVINGCMEGGLGAEPQKTWLRMPYSYNTRMERGKIVSRDRVQIAHMSSVTWTIQELLDEYMPELHYTVNDGKNKTSRKKKKSKHNRLGGYNTNFSKELGIGQLFKNRKEDIEKIAQNGIQTNGRELTTWLYIHSCFFYDYYSKKAENNIRMQNGEPVEEVTMMSHEDIMQCAYRLNSMFAMPLPENEIRSKFNSSRNDLLNRHYRYSNTTFMYTLGLTNEECEAYGLILRTSKKDIDREKSARNYNKKLARKEDLLYMIKKYYVQGLNAEKIYHELSKKNGSKIGVVSVASIHRYITEIRKTLTGKQKTEIRKEQYKKAAEDNRRWAEKACIAKRLASMGFTIEEIQPAILVPVDKIDTMIFGNMTIIERQKQEVIYKTHRNTREHFKYCKDFSLNWADPEGIISESECNWYRQEGYMAEKILNGYKTGLPA